MTKPRSLRSLTAVATLAVLCGCSSLDNCPNAQDPITIDTGVTDATNFTFQSAPPDGPLDAFPAKTEVRFKHDLGFRPLNVTTYLSFSKNGTNDNDGGSIAPTAGNEAPIECWDSQVIVVKNDTCEASFFIMVTALGRTDDDSVKCGE